MKTLKVTKENCVADIHISHTGIRVFYSINHTVKEKCYQTVEECYCDVTSIINNACSLEQASATKLATLFNNTDGYTVVISV